MNAIDFQQQLSDDQFLRQFQDLSLPSEYFSHLGHIRMTWLYLQKYDLLSAEHLVSTGIQRYAEHLGAKTKFHCTITHAYVQIIATRMKQKQQQHWQHFIEENHDLTSDAKFLLSKHFSDKLLYSEKARMTLVAPDRIPFLIT